MKLAAFTIFLAALAGCSTSRIVQVFDGAGLPVPGAEVEAVSLSVNSEPHLTDGRGEAPLPSDLFEIKWVGVRKPGYLPVQVPLPAAWPLRVTLIAEGKP